MNAVVTGAGSGLGKALAIALANDGHSVLMNGRDGEKLVAASKSVKGSVVAAGDIADKIVRAKIFAQAIKKFGKIDLLINNAGILMEGPLDEMDTEDINKVMQINTIAHMELCRIFYAHMKKQGGGTIVNVISTTGLTGKENSSVYAASKFAMRGFTDSLRFEANKSNVRVFGVYPGGMKTGLFGKKRDTSKFMDPADVAETILSMVNSYKNSTGDITIYRMSY